MTFFYFRTHFEFYLHTKLQQSLRQTPDDYDALRLDV